MKKSIFILAVLFLTTIANAQITLEHTFDGWVKISQDIIVSLADEPFSGEFITDKNNGVITIYDANNMSVLKAITTNGEVKFLSRGIFTTDSKFAYILMIRDENASDINSRLHYYIYDENGAVLADLGTAAYQEGTSCIFKVGDTYKLLLHKCLSGSYQAEVYSLPGNGEVTDVNEVSAPRRNTRKYINNDQVLIDSNDRTYTVQGNEVK